MRSCLRVRTAYPEVILAELWKSLEPEQNCSKIIDRSARVITNTSADVICVRKTDTRRRLEEYLVRKVVVSMLV